MNSFLCFWLTHPHPYPHPHRHLHMYTTDQRYDMNEMEMRMEVNALSVHRLYVCVYAMHVWWIYYNNFCGGGNMTEFVKRYQTVYAVALLIQLLLFMFRRWNRIRKRKTTNEDGKKEKKIEIEIDNRRMVKTKGKINMM